MASVRRLKSGRYQCLVTGPDGRQRSLGTFRLKSAATKAGNDYDAKRGTMSKRDPRAGKITVTEWHDKWSKGRTVAKTTKDKDRNTWNTHVKPKWSGWTLDEINPEDVREWVAEMIDGGKSPFVITSCRDLFSKMLGDAIPTRLDYNPVRGVQIPALPRKPIFFWTQAEAEKIISELRGTDALLFEFVVRTGLRYGEFAGLPVKNVDLVQGLIYVTQVQTRNHGIKEVPKSEAANRSISIPPWLYGPLGDLISGRDGDELVFVPAGRVKLHGETMQNRIDAACKRAAVKRGTLHDMRRTAASWLVQAGVPLYEVQRVLGHEDPKTTQRYAHLAPDAHTAIRMAWSREREHVQAGTCFTCGQSLPDHHHAAKAA
ncbi:tyrosine-type recombinase/integrase [Actinomadura sp. 9N215]|uniref:tyrosine-type recombinase/integrase n=1 Tax=Actinomadura sp. 9N215 TaxID=3375150 RepID=UPI0037898CB7